MRTLLLFLLLFFTTIVLAQNKTIKSLRNELKVSKSNDTKAKIQFDLAEAYYKNLKKDSAYFFAKQNFNYFEKIKNDSLKLKSSLQLNLFNDKKITKDSTDYFKIAQNIANKNNDNFFQIEVLYNKASQLFTIDEYEDAMPYLIKIDSISKKFKINNETTIYAIIKRSEIIRQQFSDESSVKAESLMLEALDEAKVLKSQKMINLIYVYLADLSGLNDKYSEAKRYIDLAFNYYKKIDDVSNISQLYLVSTAYYLANDDLENAKKMQLERIKYLRTKEDNYELARALNYYGSFEARKTKNYSDAITNLLEAKSLYESINTTETNQYEGLLYYLSVSYSKLGKFEIANQYLEDSYDLREKIDRKRNREKTTYIETKYQSEKKEQEIKLLSEVAQKQKIIYLSIVGLLIAFGTFLFFGFRNKIKTAAKINELNELKSRFFANISHEFRTPLTLIKSPVQSLQNEIKDENQKNKLNLIDKNSDRMLELVDQLLELSKLDNGKLQLILKEGNLANFLNSIVEAYQFKANESNILFSSKIQNSNDNHLFDKDVIQKIVTNLLSNAFKYTSDKEKITFSSTIVNNQLKLEVSNSGTTIKKEEISKLFERFYQKKENQQGIGIGLALVKELVELYNGTIETNIENGILSFVVTLPIETTPINTLTNNETIIESNELPILLIVDDNQDIREVLKELFETNFQVLEANDGEKGLQIALKEIPDCIISDVMMPKMDGFEFTKAIKSNELTSFIPIILLTAKTSDEAHLEGLKSTADAYLTKPFNNNIVKETVNQLIAERKKLHDRYSKELVLKPTDIVINSVDEKFLDKLQLILNQELSNADLTADDFASKMGMSRMQLHRKLKSLLGVSSTEFLRKERLKMAAALLEKGNGNISEIIYSVGFNDVSYFNRCFRDMYHCTPSEYQSKK